MKNAEQQCPEPTIKKAVDLTKLEHASIEAMKGLLSNSTETDTDSPIQLEKLCNVAISASQELFRQLDELDRIQSPSNKIG